MSITTQRGFTIIETMLFLAVTGLLVVSVLIGAGAAVNQQRYRDSVTSFVSLLQDQYANVTAVQNDRVSNWSCTDTGGLKQVGGGAGSSRGASACAVVGRVIRSTNGVTVTSDPVIARNVTSVIDSGPTSDVAALSAMSLQSLGSVDPTQIESKQLEWGATLAKPSTGLSAPSTFSLLIVRAPLSGTVRTFVNGTSGTASLASLVSSANLTNGITFCVHPQGLFTAGAMSVSLAPDSTSATDVRNNGTDPAC